MVNAIELPRAEHKKQIFAIRDLKVGFQGNVFTADNVDVAIRDLKIAVNSNTGLLSSNPEDFDLYCLGFFDLDTGFITTECSPTLIINCAELKAKEV